MKALLKTKSGQETRSPLKAKPLRLPGQSLDEEIQRLLIDKVDSYLVAAGGMVCIAVFTIETKTRSKPKRGRAIVHYDGQTVSVNGRQPDRNPIAQAKARATWLRETLARSIGLDVHVQPIVAFPGWFVEPPANPSRDVWVLSRKEEPSFIENSRQSIDSQTTKTIRLFLKQMARSG